MKVYRNTLHELAHIYWLRFRMAVLGALRGKKYIFQQKLTVPNPMLALPVNLKPCPFCDSGKKFKKCCALTLPREVLRSQANEIVEVINFAVASGRLVLK